MIPNTFVIGPHEWTIMLDSSGRTRDEGDRGSTFPERLEIVVDANLPPSLLRETIAHEIVHALWESAELGTEELEDVQVERIVAHLAPRLVDLLAGNPGIVAYLSQ